VLFVTGSGARVTTDHLLRPRVEFRIQTYPSVIRRDPELVVYRRCPPARRCTRKNFQLDLSHQTWWIRNQTVRIRNVTVGTVKKSIAASVSR
jgi:hypothetical protein